MINILIPEETPSLNKGEAAIFFGMMETFKTLDKDIHVSMFSFDPKADADNYGPGVKILNADGIMPTTIMFKSNNSLTKIIEYFVFVVKHVIFLLAYALLGNGAFRLMKRDVWVEYCRADIIILAHDSAFAPLYHTFLAIFFRFLKKRVVVYGATFPQYSKMASKLKKTTNKFLTKMLLSNIDLITLRENTTYQYIKMLSSNRAPAYLTGDLAFLAEPASEEIVLETMRQEGILENALIIGITVSANKVNFAFPSIKSYFEKEKLFVNIIAQVIDRIIETIGAEVVFIPHSGVNDQTRDDRVLAQKVYHLVRNKKNVNVIMNDYSSCELKGITGKCDLCFGTRLHFIVDSCSMFVPSIMIANREDIRSHGIFGEML